MKLRISVGRVPGRSAAEPGLKIFHRSRHLMIQGDSDVLVFGRTAAKRGFLVGDLWGSEPAGLIQRGTPSDWKKRIEGRYILAVIDRDGSCSLCADRFGQMDLYYQNVGDQYVFATDMGLLPISKEKSPDYDQAALSHALCVYGYRPPKHHTFYRGVRRLGIDQWASMIDGKMEIKENQFVPAVVGDYGERELRKYADLFLEAVEIRGSRYGNVVYLSSGWDSTAILACLVKIFGKRKVRAVIGRGQYSRRSGVNNQFELDRAKAMADYFGIRLDRVECDYRFKGPELFERLAPFLQSHQAVSFTALSHEILANFVARTTNGHEVVFSGEISDGAHNLGFSQFATIFHPVHDFREYSDKMASYLFGPTFLDLFGDGRFSGDPVYDLLRRRCANAMFDRPGRDVLSRRRQLLSSFFLRNTRIPLWSLKNNKLLTRTGREMYVTEMESVYLKRAAQEITPETWYSWILHLYNSFHWQGSTVALFSLTAQKHGFRMAMPFWDSRIQEFLAAMPESWGRGLDLNPTKYPLKWMLKHRIDYPLHLQVGPHSYLSDVDPNFSPGAELLYGSSLTPYFKKLLKKRGYCNLLSQKWFDLRYIDAVVNRYLAGVEVRGSEMNDLNTVCLLSMVC